MGSEQEQRKVMVEGRKQGRKDEKNEELTFDDEALDLFTQHTHEPRHQHSSSRNGHSIVWFPRSDPRHY